MKKKSIYKKGFTLIELIGTVVIISLMVLVITPTVSRVVKATNQRAEKQCKESIVLASRNWALSNKNLLKRGAIVFPETLTGEGYLDNKGNINNCYAGKCVKITNISTTDKAVYDYQIDEECVDTNLDLFCAYTENISDNGWTKGNINLWATDGFDSYTWDYADETIGWPNNENVFTCSQSGVCSYNDYKVIGKKGRSTSTSNTCVIKVDKKAPILGVNQGKNNVIITVSEGNASGLKNISGAIRYVFSESTTKPSSGYSDKTLTGDSKSISGTLTTTNLNGSYYLHVTSNDIVDNAGNKFTSGLAGPYVFDTVAPTITLSPNSQTNYGSGKSVVVTISDSVSKVAPNQKLYYAWSTSNTTEPTSTSWKNVSLTNTSAAASVTATIPASSSSSYTGTYYLWVKAGIEDMYGNKSVSTKTSAFYFDNTKPSCTFTSPGTIPYNKTAEFILKCTDGHSGIVSKTLSTSDFVSSSNMSITGVSAPKVLSNGYSYTITAKALAKSGSGSLAFNPNTIYDNAGNGNNSISSTANLVDVVVATPGQCYSNLEYTGSSQTLASGATNATYSGNSGTAAGIYSVTVTASGNAKFSDGTTSKTLTCEIYKKSFTTPTASAYCKTGLTYTGSSQTLVNAAGTGFTWYSGSTATDAGSHTVTAKLSNSNYRWSDGTTSNKTISCSIAKAKTATKGSCRSLTYNGSEQTLVSGGSYVSYNPQKAIEAGTYVVAVTTDSNHTFSDGETDDTLSCKINEVSISAPTASAYCKTGLTYTGLSQTLVNTAGAGFTWYSGSIATKAGNHTVTAKLAANYKWSDGAYSNKTISCSIARKSVAEPSCTSATYNGLNQTLLAAHTSGGYTNSAIRGKTVGSYDGILTLDSNYQWSSGSNVTENRVKTCSILKATPVITLSSQSGSIESGKTGKFTVTITSPYILAGTLSVESGSPSTASVSPKSTVLAIITATEGSYTASTDVTVTGISSGTSAIKLSFTPTSNYSSNFNSASNKTYSATITAPPLTGVSIPTAATYCKPNLTYTGSEQTLVETAGTGFTWDTSTTKRTNASSGYEVVAKLSSGYKWSDGTTTDKKITCSIARKLVAEPSCTTATYNGSEQTLLAAHTSGAYTNNAIKGTNAGSYTEKLKLDSNYQWSTGSNVTSDRDKSCVIDRSKTATTGSCKSGLGETGSAQTLASGATNATYSNNSQTAAGTYEVKVTANNNYAFSDGSISKTLSCKIAAACDSTRSESKVRVYQWSSITKYCEDKNKTNDNLRREFVLDAYKCNCQISNYNSSVCGNWPTPVTHSGGTIRYDKSGQDNCKGTGNNSINVRIKSVCKKGTFDGDFKVSTGVIFFHGLYFYSGAPSSGNKIKNGDLSGKWTTNIINPYKAPTSYANVGAACTAACKNYSGVFTKDDDD